VIFPSRKISVHSASIFCGLLPARGERKAIYVRNGTATRFLPRNDEVWSNWSLEGEQESPYRHLQTIILQGYLSLCTNITRSVIPVAKPKMMLILNLHAFISSVNMLLSKLGASSRTQAISQARVRSLL